MTSYLVKNKKGQKIHLHISKIPDFISLLHDLYRRYNLFFVIGSGNKVNASFVKGVAFANALHSKPTAAHNAVFFNRFHRIDRTRRVKSTRRRQKRRKKSLVRAQSG